jgi:uncharacterized membrane protein YidH (DUF202 family)
MTDIAERGQASDEGSELERIDKDLVHSSWSRAAELAGTALAVLTFLLFFLYDRAISGEVDFNLFRLTVLVVVVPMFLFMYSATYYDKAIRSVSKGDARAISYLRRADGLLAFGLVLFALEPGIILSTIRLIDLALAAFALWVVGIVFTFIIK